MEVKYITEMFAFVIVNDDGNEGIIGESVDDVWFPYVTSEEKTAKKLLPRASQIAATVGKPFSLLKFEIKNRQTFQITPFYAEKNHRN